MKSFSLLCCACLIYILSSCSSPAVRTSRTATTELYTTEVITVVRDTRDALLVTARVPTAGAGKTYSRALLFFATTSGNRDSIALDIESSGTSHSSPTSIVRCRLPQELDTASLRIGLELGSIFTVYPAVISSPDTSALSLVPFIQRADSSYVTLGVTARRNRLVDGEYLPSSEDLRVTVRRGLDVVWQSQTGLAFLTVVMPVRPEQIGEQSVYSVDWNGNDADGMPLPAGEYTAELVIPSRPAPYHTQLTFTWPLSKK
jgi:hypothetical protein